MSKTEEADKRPSVLLYRHKGTTSVTIEATITESGALQLSGHDLGEVVEEFWGDSDYEYWLTVDAEHKERLLQAMLDVQGGSDAGWLSRLRALLWRRIAAPTGDKDRLLLTLLQAQYGGDSKVISHLQAFLKAKGIPYGFDSWA